MSTRAVIVGSGYAGTGAVKKLEEVAGNSIDITWISEHKYHLVLHEVHRCIRDPSIESDVVIPVDEVKQPDTEFIHDRVTNVDVDNRIVETDTQSDIAYDHLLLAVGSETAFYGIDGLQGHAHQLKGLDDAQEIHSDVKSAAESATQQNPAKIVIGGAGLSGIQTAGEIAEYRDDKRAPMEITLVEGLDEIFPGNDTELQTALQERLEEKGVNIMTGEFISGVDENVIYIGGSEDQIQHNLHMIPSSGPEELLTKRNQQR
jgi:NADH dehydrogenase, FAD-containing subunit